MASLGNSTDFGDLATAVTTLGAASNSTRGIFAGGNSPTALRDMQFITIATTGNAQDFGDLSIGRRNGMGGLSDSHGGLGGF